MVSVHPRRQLCSMVIVVLQNNRYHHESYRIINIVHHITGIFIFTSSNYPIVVSSQSAANCSNFDHDTSSR